eukprot:13834385-Alexandrium_andersonii.AAC.1
MLIGGDLNCDVGCLAAFSEALDRGALWDLGASTFHTGQAEPLLTCCAHGAKRCTTRDYWLANSLVMPWIKSVGLREAAGYDVHTP